MKIIFLKLFELILTVFKITIPCANFFGNYNNKRMAEVSLKGIKRISSGNSDGLAKKGAGFGTSKLSKALLTVLILLALQGTFGIDGNIVSALSVKNEVVFTYMDELDVQR